MAATTLIHGAKTMAPTRQQSPDSWFQREILQKILEVKEAVDESLQLGRQNGEALRNLRTELGVDGVHGRLPQIEAAVARIDRAQETDHKELCELVEENERKTEERFKELGLKIHATNNKVDTRLGILEKGDHLEQGKKMAWAVLISVVCSSGFVAMCAWVAHQLGLIH